MVKDVTPTSQAIVDEYLHVKCIQKVAEQEILSSLQRCSYFHMDKEDCLSRQNFMLILLIKLIMNNILFLYIYISLIVITYCKYLNVNLSL